jgi:hypothetical protein
LRLELLRCRDVSNSTRQRKQPLVAFVFRLAKRFDDHMGVGPRVRVLIFLITRAIVRGRFLFSRAAAHPCPPILNLTDLQLRCPSFSSQRYGLYDMFPSWLMLLENYDSVENQCMIGWLEGQ